MAGRGNNFVPLVVDEVSHAKLLNDLLTGERGGSDKGGQPHLPCL
jgi:hypothetical protein